MIKAQIFGKHFADKDQTIDDVIVSMGSGSKKMCIISRDNLHGVKDVCDFLKL